MICTTIDSLYYTNHLEVDPRNTRIASFRESSEYVWRCSRYKISPTWWQGFSITTWDLIFGHYFWEPIVRSSFNRKLWDSEWIGIQKRRGANTTRRCDCSVADQEILEIKVVHCVNRFKTTNLPSRSVPLRLGLGGVFNIHIDLNNHSSQQLGASSLSIPHTIKAGGYTSLLVLLFCHQLHNIATWRNTLPASSYIQYRADDTTHIRHRCSTWCMRYHEAIVAPNYSGQRRYDRNDHMRCNRVSQSIPFSRIRIDDSSKRDSENMSQSIDQSKQASS